MEVLKLILLIVYLFPFETNGQFRIVGLLNVDDSIANENHPTTHHSNAQGRGFSGDEALKKFLIRPKNIVRVHLIDDVHQSDIFSGTDNILMIRTKNRKTQQSSNSVHNDTNAIIKKPSKTEKITYRTKRPQYQQRSSIPLKHTKYQLNSVIPDASENRSSVNNPIQSKLNKAVKRNRYKSRCRCVRISNCPRIQISVSRCEPNYFLCCF
ncbi:uncharacterized protein LOC116343064 [Contarinia nasturtii]|uniref:uncharacterized protein LOC116343064 n=1 Tax=Contarinia nasturtii TaxID=265458 RepID=UPI0012D46BC8|nr:uncharacterized protein LOC116343064 [Contarinia nasturtii]